MVTLEIILLSSLARPFRINTPRMKTNKIIFLIIIDWFSSFFGKTKNNVCGQTS